MNHHITSQHHPKTPQLSFPSHPHHPPCPHLILQVVATSQLHLFLLDLPSQRTLQDDHETCSNFDLEGKKMNIDMGDPRSQGSKKASETQHRDISVISLKKS